MSSKILVEGMEFFAYHGFYPEEQLVGCKYSVDLILTTDVSHAALTDELDGTINYEVVYKIVRREMEQNSKLIEHVAKRIILALRAAFPLLEEVEITLYKYNPPLGGKLNRVAIQMLG